VKVGLLCICYTFFIFGKVPQNEKTITLTTAENIGLSYNKHVLLIMKGGRDVVKYKLANCELSIKKTRTTNHNALKELLGCEVI